MGVNIVGLLNKNVKVSDVLDTLEEIIQEYVEIYSQAEDYYNLAFYYKGEARRLSVYEYYPCDEFLDGKIITMISLRKHGIANEIIESIVSRFGGMYIADDSYGEYVYLEASNY